MDNARNTEGCGSISGMDAVHAEQKAQYHRNSAGLAGCSIGREQTVGQHIDAKIYEGERTIAALRDLKASLPGSYLNSGVSRLGPLGRIA